MWRGTRGLQRADGFATRSPSILRDHQQLGQSALGNKQPSAEETSTSWASADCLGPLPPLLLPPRLHYHLGYSHRRVSALREHKVCITINYRSFGSPTALRSPTAWRQPSCGSARATAPAAAHTPRAAAGWRAPSGTVQSGRGELSALRRPPSSSERSLHYRHGQIRVVQSTKHEVVSSIKYEECNGT